MADSPDYVGSHFALEVEDVVMGYFLSVSGLEAEFETYPYSEGGLNDFVHQLKGRMRYGNLTLSRGVTRDKTLLEWFKTSKKRSERGAITIKMFDAQLNLVQSWAFSAAWAVKYSGPRVDAGDSSGMSIESLEIAHEGLVPGVS